MGKAIDFRLDSRLLPRGEKILVRIAAEASDCASAITADQANFRRQCWRWRRPSPATRWPGQKHNPRHTAEGFTSTAHPHDTVNNAAGIDRICNSCIFLLNLGHAHPRVAFLLRPKAGLRYLCSRNIIN